MQRIVRPNNAAEVLTPDWDRNFASMSSAGSRSNSMAPPRGREGVRRTAPGGMPQAPRHPGAVLLVFGRWRPARRAYRNPQEHRADAPWAAGDPGASIRWQAAFRDPRRLGPARTVRHQRRRELLHPDVRLLGAPDPSPRRCAPGAQHRHQRLRHPALGNAIRSHLAGPNARTKELELLVLECKRRTEIQGEGRRRCGHQRRLAPP